MSCAVHMVQLNSITHCLFEGGPVFSSISRLSVLVYVSYILPQLSALVWESIWLEQYFKPNIVTQFSAIKADLDRALFIFHWFWFGTGQSVCMSNGKSVWEACLKAVMFAIQKLHTSRSVKKSHNNKYTLHL